jgi:hypothetical protein
MYICIYIEKNTSSIDEIVQGLFELKFMIVFTTCPSYIIRVRVRVKY